MKALNPLPALLVVDDDLFVRKQVSHIAKPHFNVLAASSTAEVEESVLDGVDTLVLDLNIPGSDAVAFMQSLAAKAPHIRLVLVSGLALKTVKLMASVARQLQFRSVAVLSKPFTAASLTPMLLCGRDHDREATAAVAAQADPLAGFDIQAELQRALARNEFVSYFQPQVSLPDRRFVGAEALCRWQHPTLGLLGLGDFIAHLEDGPLALAFALYMADDAIARFMRARHNAGVQGHLSINFPVTVLQEPRLAAFLSSILRKHAFKPQDLIVEITERGISDDTTQSNATITQLRILGMRISLDDFGTGYSSFEKLKDIAVDEIKIDKHFVTDACHSRTSQTLILAALKIAEELDLQVVAEGIETEKVADWLASQGAVIGQGFLYAHPLPEEQLRAFLLSDAPFVPVCAPPLAAIHTMRPELHRQDFMRMPTQCCG